MHWIKPRRTKITYTIETESVMSSNAKDELAGGEELPESFEPSSHDVIVGWARQNYHHGT